MKVDTYLNWAKTKFLDQATTILKSRKAMKGLIRSVEEKVKSNFIKEQFKGLWRELKTILSLLKDTASGIYIPKSKKDIILIVVGLLYFLSPIDVIPDILVGGLIDDAAVITWILAKTKSEIDAYKATKND